LPTACGPWKYLITSEQSQRIWERGKHQNTPLTRGKKKKQEKLVKKKETSDSGLNRTRFNTGYRPPNAGS